MENQVVVSYETLASTIAAALAGEGVPSEVGAVEAEIMAEADLLGVPSHGVRMLPSLINGLRNGRVNRNPQPKLLRDHLAVCLLDGDRGPGRFVSLRGMQMAVERAGEYGIGLCVATRVSHWGRAHAYAYRAAQSKMIGICTTNAIPNMTAWGSSHHVLGNNPLAIGVPRGAGLDPIVLDMAMSQAAIGKIGTYLREGKSVPQGWGLDASGRPTDDPAAILSSGLVLPMGDHKGAGLALMMEILTGALAGGLLSHESARSDTSGLDSEGSKFLLAIDPDALGGIECFAQRVNDLLAYIGGEFEPGQEFLYPGERGWRTRATYLTHGIPIHEQIVEQLQSIGVNFPGD